MQRYQYLQRQRQEMIPQEQRPFPQRFQHSDAIILPPLRSPTTPFQVEEPEQLRSRASPLLGRPRSGSFVPKYPLSPMQIDMPAPLTLPRGSPRLPTPIMHPLPPTMSPSILHEPVMQSPRDFQPAFYHDTAAQHRQGSTPAIVQSPVQQRTSFSYTSHVLHQDTALQFRQDPQPTVVQLPVQQVLITPQSLHLQHQRNVTLDDFPPSKRRRHSDSPLRLPAIVHNLDVTEPPRVPEQKLNSEPSEPKCRVDALQVVQSMPQPVPPPIAAANGPTILPRKSSHEGGKKPLSYLEPHMKERDFNKVASSSGRRSPPGSAVGRAKAAKKIDEMREAPKKDPIPSPVTVTVKPQGELLQTAQHGVVSGSKKRAEETEVTVRDIPIPASSGTNQVDPQMWSAQQENKLSSPSAARSTIPTLLVAAELTRDDAVITPSLSRSTAVPDKREVPPQPQPLMSDEATLEQQLEELLAEPEESEENKMDIDHDVTQLAVETLDHGEDEEEVDINKQDPYNSEADVDLELLRLVDDQPSADGQSRHDLESPARTASPNVATASFLSSTVNPAPSPDAVPTPSDRGSMPPPAHQPVPSKGKDQVKHGEEKKVSKPGSGLKKKETGTKVSKLKATATGKAPKAKSTAKSKVKTSEGTATPPLAVPKPGKVPIPLPVKKSVSSTAASRSRSASVMPAGPEGDVKPADKQEDEESSDGANDDDKLYCVCKTKYDEERCMIACDKCDEWYHMQCVNISEFEADLVDQFFCPTCIESNPHASLRTTYKQRCLNGLKHMNPQSSDACHQPALGSGILSKFCSQDCGVEYMTNRIDTWVKKGGKREKLWESVKHAEKREGIVIEMARTKSRAAEVVVKTEDIKPFTIESRIKEESKSSQVKAAKSSLEIEQLKNSLSRIVKLREEIKKGMEVVLWREKLLELATDRAQVVGQCGWDQRLCFGDEEWDEFGMGVLESYEASTSKADNDMQVDGAGGPEDGEWWCPGRTMCDRHAGWQNIRAKDITKEKEQKEEALAKLTTRERELRKRIEDLVDPTSREIKDTPIKKPLKLSNSNGRSKTGHFVQKGKKRKNIVH